MIFKLIRQPLGKLILAIDAWTAPKSPDRDPALQGVLDAATGDLALYHYQTCPFCVRTRRAIRRLGLNIELRDAQHDPKWRQQLVEQGGRRQVPCLYIPTAGNQATWMYESKDIIAYLEKRCAELETARAA